MFNSTFRRSQHDAMRRDGSVLLAHCAASCDIRAILETSDLQGKLSFTYLTAFQVIEFPPGVIGTSSRPTFVRNESRLVSSRSPLCSPLQLVKLTQFRRVAATIQCTRGIRFILSVIHIYADQSTCNQNWNEVYLSISAERSFAAVDDSWILSCKTRP